MADKLEARFNSLIANIEKDFYEKKNKIIKQFQEIEKKKKSEYTKIKNKISVLKTKELKIKKALKNINNELKTVLNKLGELKDRKETDEQKIAEFKRIKKEYPLILKKLDLYSSEKDEILDKKSAVEMLANRLNRKISTELKKVSELRGVLDTIDESERELKSKKISDNNLKKALKSIEKKK